LLPVLVIYIDAPLPGPPLLPFPPINVTLPLAVTKKLVLMAASPVVITPACPPILIFLSALLPPVLAVALTA